MGGSPSRHATPFELSDSLAEDAKAVHAAYAEVLASANVSGTTWKELEENLFDHIEPVLSHQEPNSSSSSEGSSSSVSSVSLSSSESSNFSGSDDDSDAAEERRRLRREERAAARKKGLAVRKRRAKQAKRGERLTRRARRRAEALAKIGGLPMEREWDALRERDRVRVEVAVVGKKFSAANRNAPSNRYGDIRPFDETRVRLKRHQADPGEAEWSKESRRAVTYLNGSWVRLDVTLEPVTVPFDDVAARSKGLETVYTAGQRGQVPGIRPFDPESPGLGLPFIATQAPNDVTTPDFLRAIWEHDTRVVVMLTKLREGGTQKANNYWCVTDDAVDAGPSDFWASSKGKKKGAGAGASGSDSDSDEAIPTAVGAPPLVAGDFSVQVMEEERRAGGAYVVRKLRLTLNGPIAGRTVPNEEKPVRGVWREITQFQYVAWPDHGVPDDPGDMLALMRDVNEEADRYESASRKKHRDANRPLKPVLVHCSAGVGRTGTFIVIDTMQKALTAAKKSGGEAPTINVADLVDQMRAMRKGMLTSPEQFEFCYRTIAEFVRELNSSDSDKKGKKGK